MGPDKLYNIMLTGTDSDILNAINAYTPETNSYLRNPVHQAVSANKVSIVKILLDKDNNGYTVLHIAARKGKTHLVKFFLLHGANVKSDANDTLINSAVSSRNIHTVRYIINYDRKLLNANAIIPALDNNDNEMLQFLIDYGVDINQKNRYGNTALHYAIEKKQEN
ncbi:CRPV-181 [Crowpox virus]|nr:CRPV-181 [Crowpox virus]